MIEWDELLKVGILVLTSSTKFLFAPGAAASFGYNFWQIISITISGGFLGISLFYFAGGWVMAQFGRLTITKRKDTPPAPKKAFTRTNKFIVKVKSRFGLIGLAIITPCIISIPIGTLLAARYFGKNKKTYPYLLVSVVAWSFILTTATMFLKPLVQDLF